MKLCKRCNTTKPESEFRKDKRNKDGLYFCCKVCSSGLQSKSYQKLKEVPGKFAWNQKERRKQQTLLLKEMLQPYKANGCKICQETEDCCLEFHHLDPTIKDFGVGNSWWRKFEDIRQEIEKCIVVCSNCHKKIHAGVITL